MWLYYNFTIPISFILVASGMTLVTGQNILLETISYCLSEKHTMKYTAKIKEMFNHHCTTPKKLHFRDILLSSQEA